MNVFKELGKDLNYKDILQVDGAFSACHINYGKSLKFNGADSKNMAQNSRKNSLTENGHIDDLEAVQYDFNGTEKDFKKQDIILLWEKYWLEYINAFNKLVAELPDSIVTVYVGRHAIELSLIHISFQTNGYGITDDWCMFFKENKFLVGVSVDGLPEIHDSIRHNKIGDGTFEQINKNIKLLDKYNVEYNILTVVTPKVAKNIKSIYAFYKQRGWHYQQYICLLYTS